MKILHTADWHLGKRLDFYERLDEQRKALAEIGRIAKQEEVDLILIAGDLYDTFNPPNEATELLYKTLKKLAANGSVPVMAIAGNHDSPDRVSVADVLARESGILLIGHPTDEVPLFEVEGGFKLQKTEPGFLELNLPKYDYPVRILHTAFANEMRLKEYFGEDKQQSLQQSLSQKWQDLANRYCDDDGVNLLTTHLYMMKKGAREPEEPEGEKPLNIGNADVVYSEAIPKQIQYAALGHLHRYQDVGVYQPAVYSSSLLAYSFSEAGQQKSVSIIEAEPAKGVKLKKVPLTSGKPLVRETFYAAGEAVEWLLKHPDLLVEITLETDDFIKVTERKKIFQSHDGIIHLIPRVKNSGAVGEVVSNIDLGQDMDVLFKDYFKSKFDGQEPNEELMNLFYEIKNK